MPTDNFITYRVAPSWNTLPPGDIEAESISSDTRKTKIF